LVQVMVNKSLKGYAMKIDMTRTTNKPKKLPNNKYGPMAKAMINSHLNAKSELTDAQFNKLKATIDGYRNGEPNNKGFTIYVKYLMGAMNRISPELVDRLAASSNDTESESESEFF